MILARYRPPLGLGLPQRNEKAGLDRPEGPGGSKCGWPGMLAAGQTELQRALTKLGMSKRICGDSKEDLKGSPCSDSLLG